MKSIPEKLKKHYSEKLYTKLTRVFGDSEESSCGYILNVSSELILFRESDDFKLLAYQIIPIDSIAKVRYNKSDKTYQRIMLSEGLVDQLELKYTIDITNWKTACKDVKKTKLTIISECEHPELEFFCIGELKRVNEKSISIRYFDSTGLLDTTNTIHDYEDITKLSFDDHYANVFSKYVREK